MENEYKRLVLLEGLECINKHQFNLFKSLMVKDLNLEEDNQEKYTTFQIANMMVKKFPADAGLDKLINFCERVPTLKKRAEILKKERSEVTGETSLEINRQEAGPATPTSTTSHMLASERGETSATQEETSTAQVRTSTAQAGTSTAQAGTSTAQKRKGMSEEKTDVKKIKASGKADQPPCCEGPTATCQSPISQVSSSASSNIPSAKNQKSQPQNQNIPRGAVLHSEPLTVMVLTATDPFEYESPEHEVKNMFHATVATVSQYFHVKVFNIDLKEKFTKNNFITISNYFESKGILEINETSSVLEAAPKQMIEVPNCITRNANASPKICDIQKGTSGTVFYGVFTLHKKKVKTQNTSYEIKDGSGSIEVVGSGQWHNINCKEGDKLHLFCFHLKRERGQPKLVCGDHSFVKVTKAGKKKEASTVQSSTKNEEENDYPKVGIKVEMPK